MPNTLIVLMIVVSVALVITVAGCWGGGRALNVEIELEQIERDAIPNVPSELTIRVEKGKLLITTHLIATNSRNKSDVHITGSVDGNTITVLEEMGNPNYVSSLLSTFKLTETIDTQSLTPGAYTLIVKRHSWETGSKSENTLRHWTDVTVFRQQVAIGQ